MYEGGSKSTSQATHFAAILYPLEVNGNAFVTFPEYDWTTKMTKTEPVKHTLDNQWQLKTGNSVD